MGILGVQTADFALYHDLVEALRQRGVPFMTIPPGTDPVPSTIAVVLTSTTEAPHVAHRVVVGASAETIATSVDEALARLSAPGPYRRVVIGVDPGERPGLAIVGDGRVLRLAPAAAPEAVADAVRWADEALATDELLVRIGDGAPTFRDRVLVALAALQVAVEVVDERRSTPTGPRGGAQRDVAAATRIALTPGRAVAPGRVRVVEPTDGELRDIQRKSRLLGDGTVTIGRSEARAVALGHLNLEEAVAARQGGVRDAAAPSEDATDATDAAASHENSS